MRTSSVASGIRVQAQQLAMDAGAKALDEHYYQGIIATRDILDLSKDI
jgi:hypothetical protein